MNHVGCSLKGYAALTIGVLLCTSCRHESLAASPLVGTWTGSNAVRGLTFFSNGTGVVVSTFDMRTFEPNRGQPFLWDLDGTSLSIQTKDEEGNLSPWHDAEYKLQGVKLSFDKSPLLDVPEVLFRYRATN